MIDNFTKKYGSWSVIIGASMGIGAACAREFARNGINVVLVARSTDKLEALCEEIRRDYGVEAMPVTDDFTKKDCIEVLDEKIKDLDVGSAVYSAAVCYSGGFLMGTMEEYHNIMALNIEGALLFSKYFGERFCRQKRGGLLYLGSLAGYYSAPYTALYSGTKGFEIMLAE